MTVSSFGFWWHAGSRGQSLVVWAIHEGRQAARQIDQDLMGYSSLAGAAGIVQTKKMVTA